MVFTGGLARKDGSVGAVKKCSLENEEAENLQNLKENKGTCPLCQLEVIILISLSFLRKECLLSLVCQASVPE